MLPGIILDNIRPKCSLRRHKLSLLSIALLRYENNNGKEQIQLNLKQECPPA